MRWFVRFAIVGLVCGATATIDQSAVLACTAFCASGGGRVLVGNNEDFVNPRTKIWFVPAKPGSFGRVYVGYDDLWPQGGMNERGLWFDGFSAPAVKGKESTDLPHFPGNIVDTAMATCTSVEEVVRLFSRYNRAFLVEGILMFADASGDAVSIERNAMVRKTGAHFVQTNFHQSRPHPQFRDQRFTKASAMLEEAGSDVSIDVFRRILDVTHQDGTFVSTLYSNIYDLQARVMHLYYFHDFEHVVTFDLAEELKKGERVLDIPALFPKNAAAEAFAARRSASTGPPTAAIAAAGAALLVAAIVLLVYGWVRAGRRFRIGLVASVAAVVIVVALTVLTLRMHDRTSAPWMGFSIGPASGDSVSIQPNVVRGNGITLETALATAYEIPAVRILGPSWLKDTRYSINAVVDANDSDSLRPWLQKELQNRLRLQTHFEVRPFDVFVLTADTPRLGATQGPNPSIAFDKQSVRLQNASMERLASALQNVVKKPVIDQTGIAGTYNLELAWGEERVASVTTVLRNRFGLRLSPGKQEMEALIVDGIRRDASLVLLAEIGRLTRGAPPYLRQQIASILTID